MYTVSIVRRAFWFGDKAPGSYTLPLFAFTLYSFFSIRSEWKVRTKNTEKKFFNA